MFSNGMQRFSPKTNGLEIIGAICIFWKIYIKINTGQFLFKLIINTHTMYFGSNEKQIQSEILDSIGTQWKLLCRIMATGHEQFSTSLNFSITIHGVSPWTFDFKKKKIYVPK